MSRKICKLVKDDIMNENLKKYTKLVEKPRFVCTKCGHVANDKENLCKPKKMHAK